MKDLVLKGDVYACLETLKDNSIAVAITSPPYWKQRDYGFSGQIGQEATLEEYIGRLVAVYSKLRQKLKEDGIFFLNVGDKYSSRYGSSHLLQIPYRLAWHMVKDGWILEDVIIWYKTNHMPSSVKDRFTNTYEPVLVLAKRKKNRYKADSNVLKLALQQTQWKHTATFPEALVRNLLKRVDLGENDLILDPFAGTGTTGLVVKKIRHSLYAKKIYTILIEMGEEFIEILQQRVGIRRVHEVESVKYDWEPIEEDSLPDIAFKEISSNKYGEVFIADTSAQFLAALKGIKSQNFHQAHRLDSLFFYGVKNWELADLYYISRIFEEGYVLRNMIIITEDGRWYPVFMFASSNTRFRYRFYLDRVRIHPQIEARDWKQQTFIGMTVRDISGKKRRKGKIIEVLKRYEDYFPKILAVNWRAEVSLEFAIHPKIDEFLREGVNFACPSCKSELEEPYDILDKTICPKCGVELWKDIETVPILKEPQEIIDSVTELENGDFSVGESFKLDQIEEKQTTSSKFADLDRINWGASPGARKVMLGEYFTKMRLYRIDQPMVAQYLTFLRNGKGLSIKDITNLFPENYTHTVGHWFRKDMGGSLPIPEDVRRLERVFEMNNKLFTILRRTALKFQTVKASIKGRNPGDFLEFEADEELKKFLRKLFITPKIYAKMSRNERCKKSGRKWN